MGAKATVARHRGGIDQDRGLGAGERVREVGALGVVGLEVAVWWEDDVGDRDRRQARRVDQRFGSDGGFLVAK